MADVEEAQAARTLAAAQLVLDIATAASTEPKLDPVLRMALDRLGDVVEFSSGSVSLVDGDTLIVRASTGYRRRSTRGPRIAPGTSPRWTVIRELRPMRLDDVRRRGSTASRLTRSWLGAPIVRGDEALGLVELESTTPAWFSDADERLVATVAQALAGPIDVAEQYLAAQRAQELREAFTGVISHELRTPITTIYGMSQVLRQRHKTMDPIALRQMIEDIEGEADRLRRLAEDLLVLSRTESGRLEVTLDPLLMGHVVRRRVADESAHWPDHRFVAELPAGSGAGPRRGDVRRAGRPEPAQQRRQVQPARGPRCGSSSNRPAESSACACSTRGWGSRAKRRSGSSSCSTARRMRRGRRRGPASACSCAVS